MSIHFQVAMIFAALMLKFFCKLSKLSPPGSFIFSKAKSSSTNGEPLAIGIYVSVTLTDWGRNLPIGALCCDLCFDIIQIEQCKCCGFCTTFDSLQEPNDKGGFKSDGVRERISCISLFILSTLAAIGHC